MTWSSRSVMFAFMGMGGGGAGMADAEGISGVGGLEDTSLGPPTGFRLAFEMNFWMGSLYAVPVMGAGESGPGVRGESRPGEERPGVVGVSTPTPRPMGME